MPEQLPIESAERTLDLTRLIGIKWGDKMIDPAEVEFVLTPLPTVECPECHQEAGRPHTDYCSLALREEVFAASCNMRHPATGLPCLVTDPGHREHSYEQHDPDHDAHTPIR